MQIDNRTIKFPEKLNTLLNNKFIWNLMENDISNMHIYNSIIIYIIKGRQKASI